MATKKRLIDANALEQIFLDESRRLRKQIINDEVSCEEAMHIRSFMPTIEWARKTVHGCATVDAVEVVHGRWHDVALRYTEVKEECSVCHGVVRVHGFRYCPNCGAKMDGDGNAAEAD